MKPITLWLARDSGGARDTWLFTGKPERTPMTYRCGNEDDSLMIMPNDCGLEPGECVAVELRAKIEKSADERTVRMTATNVCSYSDDAVLIDVSWLVTVGFTTNLTHVWIHHENRVTSTTLIARITSNGDWYFRIESRSNTQHETVEAVCFPRSYRTRGDVRRLCDAVGITLNENYSTTVAQLWVALASMKKTAHERS